MTAASSLSVKIDFGQSISNVASTDALARKGWGIGVSRGGMMDDPRSEGPVSKFEYPPEVKDAVSQLEDHAVCAQTFTITWQHGPKKGLPVTVYCAEPLCITTGDCTGPRFVPHIQQYTTTDTDDPRWGPRKITQAEAVAAVREVGKAAERQGATPILISDRAILAFIKKVWGATMRAVGSGEGAKSGWTR